MSINSSNSAFGRFIFMDFCKPAKVYLMIALVTLIYYVIDNEDFIWIALKAALFIGWGFLLNKLCNSGLKAISWTMAIVPQFLFLILTVKASPADNRVPASTQEE